MRSDEARRLRIRDDAIVDDLGRGFRGVGDGAPTLVARTIQLSVYPTTARRYYACTPVSLLGPESEGGAPVLTPILSSFLALNLGGSVPPKGTDVVATFIDNRWVFRYDA